VRLPNGTVQLPQTNKRANKNFDAIKRLETNVELVPV
jgi:hypothetical protein